MKENSSLSFFDILLIWIGIVSALIVLTLALEIFSPSIILIGATIVTLLILSWVKLDVISEARFDMVFWALLLLALMFRYSNATHYVGGQDQGVYVNMSDDLTESGKIQFVDRLRESLPEDLQVQYDSYVEPGVGGVDNSQTSEYSADFYPMHPAWMALATFLFGEGRHILSLLFFSLVGLAGMYLLTMEISSNNKKAGYIVLLLGALNPGLVYFTTFPVGELVALCLSVNGFYLLGRAFRCESSRMRWLFLAGSALLFSAFCYTRMTFFIFSPLFVFILFVVFFFKRFSHLRLSISLYVLSLGGLFGLSWVFYYQKLYDLAFVMNVAIFTPLMEKYGALIVFAFVIMLILLYISTQQKFNDKLYKIAEDLTTWLERYVAFFLFAVLVLSFAFIPKLYTDGINARVPLQPYPLIFQFSSIYYLMLFISPALLFALFVFPFFRFRLERPQIILVMFLVVIWSLLLIQNTYNDYLYYFGRYFCSEMVPYSLILCGIVFSIFLDTLRWRYISIAFIVAAVGYAAVFSAIQIGHAETENPESLYELDQIIGSADVIIYENVLALGDSSYGIHNHGLLLTTPLKMYFDKQVFRLESRSLTQEDRFKVINYFYNNSALNSESKYGSIYILTHTPIVNDTEKSLELVEMLEYSFGRLINPHQYKTGPLDDIDTWKQLLLPYHYSEYRVPIYLYRVNKRLGLKSLSDFNIDFSARGNSIDFDLTGISGQEKNFRWTDGNVATVSAPIIPNAALISRCQLRIVADVYTNGNFPTQRFGVRVNGADVGWVEDGRAGEFLFDIPADLINNAESIMIELILPDANSPIANGSFDSRLLGLALKEIQLLIQSDT